MPNAGSGLLGESVRTAIVHHWLVTMRGGERSVEAILELFPHAEVFTLVSSPDRLSSAFRGREIHTSFLQRLPRATRWYPYYLPLFPKATEGLDLSGFELVISSDSATMKGVRTDPGCAHVCYCHTPMRYVWSGYDTYRRSAGLLGRLAFPRLAAWLRRWDYQAAQRVTRFVANSRNVRERIRRSYGRESAVIYPPVDTDYFRPPSPRRTVEDYFLVVSQLVAYKKVDIIVEAFNRCGWPLVVIGEGRERRRLERRARPNIRFLGFQPDPIVRQAMQSCRALVFAGEEDFGIVMAETLACGRPVIALGRGGAPEIVTDGATGVLFEDQSVDSLLNGLRRFGVLTFDPEMIRASALKFDRGRFLAEFLQFVQQTLESPSLAGQEKAPAALHPAG